MARFYNPSIGQYTDVVTEIQQSPDIFKGLIPLADTQYGEKTFKAGVPIENANPQKEINRPILTGDTPAPPILTGDTPAPPTAPAPIDINSYRESEQQRVQAQIDAINRAFGFKLEQAREEGKVREAQTRGLNVRSGLAGSDFASAAAAETRGVNLHQQEGINAERLAKVEEILGKADENAIKLAQLAQQEAQNIFTMNLQSRQQMLAEKKQLADEGKDLLAAAAAKGQSFSIIKPETIQPYIDAGVFPSIGAAELFYNSKMPQAQASDFKFEDVGDGVVRVWQFDRTTGEFKRRSDLDTTSIKTTDGAQEYHDITTPDGTVLLVPKKIDPTKSLDEQILRYGQEGQFAKPEASGLTPTQLFDRELKLANDFEKYAQESRSAISQLNRIKASYQEAQKRMADGESINATSQGVLVAFQKILDPTSVVRESEYARSGQGLALIDRIEGFATKIKQGGAGLTADALKEFVDLGEEFMRGYQNNQLNFARRTQKQAESIGANLERVLTPDVINLLKNDKNNILRNPDGTEEVNIADLTPAQIKEAKAAGWK